MDTSMLIAELIALFILSSTCGWKSIRAVRTYREVMAEYMEFLQDTRNRGLDYFRCQCTKCLLHPETEDQIQSGIEETISDYEKDLWTYAINAIMFAMVTFLCSMELLKLYHSLN